MFEYMVAHDKSEDLDGINELAEDGWRVVGCFSDAQRGILFVLERYAIDENAATLLAEAARKAKALA